MIHGFDRRQRPFAVVDLRALIVFDDRDPVLIGQFEDLPAPFQAQHCSFGVVEAGVHIDKLRLAALDDFIQVVRDHPVLIGRNREQLAAGQFDGPVDIGSHNLIDNDPVSRRQHELQNEIQRLVVLRKDLYIGWLCADADGCHILDDLPDQLRIALVRHVEVCLIAAAAEHLFEYGGDFLRRIRLPRRYAPGKGYIRGIEALAVQFIEVADEFVVLLLHGSFPVDVFSPVGGIVLRAASEPHSVAAALRRIQKPFALQFSVSPGHCIPVHAKFRSQRALRRQHIAVRKFPGVEHTFDLSRDLHVDRCFVVPVDFEFHRSVSPAITVSRRRISARPGSPGR